MKLQQYFIFFASLLNISFAQTLDTTLSQVRNRFAHLKPDSTFDSPYYKWKRNEAFWVKRLGVGGSFKAYEQAYQRFYDTLTKSRETLMAEVASHAKSSTPTSSLQSFGNWKELGPFQIQSNALMLGRTDRVQVDPSDLTGKTIYVMCGSAIFKTINGGQTWTNFNTDNAFPAQAFTDMKLIKDKKTGKKYLYVAVGGHMMKYINQTFADGFYLPFYGMYRTEIGTNKWQDITGNLISEGMLGRRLSSHIYTILIDPNDVNRVYLGTSEGVFYNCMKGCKSLKNGQGFEWKKSGHTLPVLGLALDYSNGNHTSLYCSGEQLFYTNNIENGKAFKAISITNDTCKYMFNNLTTLPNQIPTLPSSNIIGKESTHLNIATHPSYPTKVFMSLSYNYQYLMGTTPVGSNNMAMLVYDKASTEVFPNNFTALKIGQGSNLHMDKNFIHVSPYNAAEVVYNTDFWGTSEKYDLKKNAVVSVIRASHADSHDFDFSPNKKEVVFTNDGGVYKSNFEANVNPTCINGYGLGVSTFYGGNVFEKDGKKAMGGFQDNYTLETDNIYSKDGWKLVSMSTGDGDRALYLSNGDVYYNSCYNDGYPYFIRKANSNTTLSFEKPCRMGGVWNKVYKSPTGKEELYLTGEELCFTKAPYTPTNNSCTSSFVQLSDYASENAAKGACYNYYMGDFDISADQKTIYALFINNAAIWYPACQQQLGSFVSVIKTTVGGKNNPNLLTPCTGTNCWTSLPDMNTLKLTGFASNIAMNPSHPDQVWIGSSGYTYPSQPTFTRRIVYSSDGGKTFIDFSEGLPDVSINRIVVGKDSDYEVYAATDLGVFYRNSSMKSWQRVGKKLPFVVCSDLQLDTINQKLYVYTFGRGMWTIDVPKLMIPKTLMND